MRSLHIQNIIIKVHVHYYIICPQSIQHSTQVPFKLHQLHQSGLLESFCGSASEIECLGKTLLRFHHAPTHSIELHSCPFGTPNIHYLYQNLSCKIMCGGI
jgi:hypothetical protein